MFTARNARSWQQLPSPNREVRNGKRKCRCGVVHFSHCEVEYRNAILGVCKGPRIANSNSLSIAAREIGHALQSSIESLRGIIGTHLKRVFAFVKNNAIRVVFRFSSHHEMKIELPGIPAAI